MTFETGLVNHIDKRHKTIMSYNWSFKFISVKLSCLMKFYASIFTYWINVSAHIQSTIGKVCFVLKSLSLITFLTMGISSDYGREARCSSYDQGKDRRDDRFDKDWTRKASSSDRLAYSRFIFAKHQLARCCGVALACFMYCCMQRCMAPLHVFCAMLHCVTI